jgi:two-component sensor histidine kinase
MVFTITDNGTGMPENLDISLLETLGLKIVEKFVKQIKGTMETVVSNGTMIDIRFPLKKKEEAQGA